MWSHSPALRLSSIPRTSVTLMWSAALSIKSVAASMLTFGDARTTPGPIFALLQMHVRPALKGVCAKSGRRTNPNSNLEFSPMISTSPSLQVISNAPAWIITSSPRMETRSQISAPCSSTVPIVTELFAAISTLLPTSIARAERCMSFPETNEAPCMIVRVPVISMERSKWPVSKRIPGSTKTSPSNFKLKIVNHPHPSITVTDSEM
mmetsp:Transcript_47789/g.139403  ORF Transcript_47789/g.139403 Transcript_47789/m.139403 type:complete len:207 (-) Transcript_47789:183-803(-)